MLIKSFRINQSVLIIIGILLSIFIVVPVCFAGGALTIVRDEKQFAPRGSFIPERRVQQILKKVEERKAKIKASEALDTEKASPRDAAPEPQSPKEK